MWEGGGELSVIGRGMIPNIVTVDEVTKWLSTGRDKELTAHHRTLGDTVP